MDKYGEAAVQAVKLFTRGSAGTPELAWNKATSLIFGANTPSQKKGCPRGAFLGLCEDGLVKGIPKGRYTNSKKNKGYAIKAVSILKANPGLFPNPRTLWNRTLSGIEKQHNSQMDVVLSLWQNQFIL